MGNLAKRIISAVVMIIIGLVACYYGSFVLLAVILFVAGLAYHEVCIALGIRPEGEQEYEHPCALEWVGVGCHVAYCVVAFFGPSDWYLLLIIMLELILSIGVYVVRYPRYRFGTVAKSFTAYIYTSVSLLCIYHLRCLPKGRYLVWLPIIAALGTDCFAYIVGMTLGRHRGFTALSPRKSIEGCIGGVLGAGVLGGVYGYFFLTQEAIGGKFAWLCCAIVCMIVGAISIFGDLAASGIKREAGIKDYGNIIPGHGGMMDRFDSLAVTAPIMYFLVIIISNHLY